MRLGLGSFDVTKNTYQTSSKTYVQGKYTTLSASAVILYTFSFFN